MILSICAVVGWSYVLFFSDLFIINNTIVEGIENLDPIDVHREVLATLDERGEWRPWPERHMFFVNEDKLRDQLMERLFV